MCCCFSPRGEHVEQVKKISQQEIDAMKEIHKSNGNRAPVPAGLGTARNRSRSSGSNPGRTEYPNRLSQSGSSHGGYGSSDRESRVYNNDRNTSHEYGHGGYGSIDKDPRVHNSDRNNATHEYVHGGYGQRGRSEPPLGNKALRSGLGSTPRYTPRDLEYRR
ncbi:hypothetical protein BCIN_04g04050 [Botrytis cinerea B05.10]|uniref:Uncharacterized protein n=1 Tax=Botryotinia fuckeliana (strain B05.10) TaxID=332648 RepID=A0A384JF50_BOTFB|nr:hypothetical protein BCIN_04g04050 [Botrytis cinerea B05.10]ATZ49229.1 hypothetical protein BCIN_04g04050 [Botrytis cinerea B05.10]